MANILKMAKIQSIRQLHAANWSQRRIARELELDRGTVARYLQSAPANPKAAIPPAGSGGANAATISPLPDPLPPSTGKTAGPDSAAPSNAAIPPAGLPLGNVEPLVAAPSCRAGRPNQCQPLRDLILAKLIGQLAAQRIWQDLKAGGDVAGRDGKAHR